MKMQSQLRPNSKLIITLFIFFVLRLYFAANINFLEDEAYYRLWGLYPFYAYFDHAPMVGWWIAIGQTLFGDTHIGLRFLAPVASFVGSLCVWRIANLGYDRKTADHAVLIFNAMLLMGVGSVLMTPDVPSVFFWGLALWTIVEWYHSRRQIWWIYFGVAAGLGLLSKYTNGFLGIGVLVWLALSGLWRDAIRMPQFWIAGLIAAAFFSPVLYWNVTHEWVSFTRQIERLQSHGITLTYLGELVAGQSILISPIICIFTAIAILRSRSIMRNLQSIQALIIVTTLPLILYLGIHVLESRINANWIAPVYPNLALLTAPVVAKYEIDPRVVLRRLANYAVPSGFALTLIVLLESVYPLLPPDPRNPMSQIRGYAQFSSSILAEQKIVGASVILTSRYQLTAVLDYELREQARIIQVTEPIRFLNQPEGRADLGVGPYLYVAREGEAASFIENYRSCFRAAKPIKILQRFDRGVVMAVYEIWKIEGLDKRIMLHGEASDCR